MTQAVEANPLKFNLFSETADGHIHRSIEVQPDGGGWYRVQTMDVVSSNALNHGLLSGRSRDDIATSNFNSEVNGVYKLLKEANAEATAIFQNYLVAGWQDETKQQPDFPA